VGLVERFGESSNARFFEHVIEVNTEAGKIPQQTTRTKTNDETEQEQDTSIYTTRSLRLRKHDKVPVIKFEVGGDWGKYVARVKVGSPVGDGKAKLSTHWWW
jgi:hypothetical protein